MPDRKSQPETKFAGGETEEAIGIAKGSQNQEKRTERKHTQAMLCHSVQSLVRTAETEARQCRINFASLLGQERV